jgi:transcriptional regulator with XRE-family HTH domain
MRKSIYEFIARRIRQERKKAGLTIERLAEFADISTSFLSYIETNKKKPSLNTIQKIADALDVPLSGLFEELPGDKNRDSIYEAKQRFGQIIHDKSRNEIYAILDMVKISSRFISEKSSKGRRKNA